jgi:hypothetical protein
MKNFVLHLFFCLVIVGCKDDEVETIDCPVKLSSSYSSASVVANATPPKHPCDYITALKNGEEWTVWATTHFGSKNDTLYVGGVGNEETLSFKFHFTGPGIYEITTTANHQYLNGNAYYYTTIGLDVINARYLLAKKAIVEIVEYNKTEKMIKGNFEFSFNEYSGSSTYSFEQGTFSVHLPD